MKEEFYDKFPCVLRKSLKGGSVNFPEDMKKEFREFTAYRGITRKGSVEIQINKNDFCLKWKSFVMEKFLGELIQMILDIIVVLYF